MQGTESMEKTNKRDAETRALIRKTHRITGKSERTVERAINGDPTVKEATRELIMGVYMDLLEHGDEQENKLKKAVKELVPIPTPTKISTTVKAE